MERLERLWKRLDRRHWMGLGVLFVVVMAASAWAVRVPPEERPPLRIAGAGFMFNYRVADAYYGFTAQLMKPVRDASVIEAEFEDPAGGPPIRVETPLWAATRQYGIRTPNLSGIEKDRPYKVHVRLLDGYERVPIYETSFTVTSSLSDAIVPKAPTVIGPGYMENPAVPLEENHRG